MVQVRYRSAVSNATKCLRIVSLQLLVTFRKDVHLAWHSHSNLKSAFSDTAKNTTFSDVAAVSDPHKIHALWHSYSHDMSAFSDTARKPCYETLQLLVTLGNDVQYGIHKAPISSRLVTRQESRRFVILQRLVTL